MLLYGVHLESRTLKRANMAFSRPRFPSGSASGRSSTKIPSPDKSRDHGSELDDLNILETLTYSELVDKRDGVRSALAHVGDDQTAEKLSRMTHDTDTSNATARELADALKSFSWADDTIHDRVARLEVSIETAEEGLQELQLRADGLQDENQRLQAELEALQQVRENSRELQSHADGLSNENQKLQAELEGLREVQSHADGLRNENQTLRAELKDANEKVQQQRSQRRELEDELDQLTEEKDEFARKSLTFTQAQNCAKALKRLNNYDRIVPFLEDVVEDFSAAYVRLNLDASPIWRRANARMDERQREVAERKAQRLAAEEEARRSQEL